MQEFRTGNIGDKFLSCLKGKYRLIHGVVPQERNPCKKTYSKWEIHEDSKLEEGYLLPGKRWSIVIVLVAEIKKLKSLDICKVNKDNDKFIWQKWTKWVEVKGSINNEEKFSVLGVHIPTGHNLKYKKLFWDCILNFADKNNNKNSTIIIGDFNTGLDEDTEGMPFRLKGKMEKLKEEWTDAWLEANINISTTNERFTFYSKDKKTGKYKNGFRLDYAFLSQNLKKRLKSNAYHDHTVRVDKQFSDHSALSVEVSEKDT